MNENCCALSHGVPNKDGDILWKKCKNPRWKNSDFCWMHANPSPGVRVRRFDEFVREYENH